MAQKCHLFQKEVGHLGHAVDRGQLKVQEMSIWVLKEASRPRFEEDLRRVFGICNFDRRFVKVDAEVARPLVVMTSTKRPDCWALLSDEA